MIPFPEIGPPIVVVLRAADAARFVEVSTALVAGGVRAVEFTFTSAGCVDAVREAKRVLPADVAVGCGTVRSRAHVDAAVAAGADFLVSQLYDEGVVRYAAESGIPYVPGALTPTEIACAAGAQVPAVKVSPIGPLGGPAYLRELTGPLPEIRLFPTGGVKPSQVVEYLEAGAAMVGLSSLLLEDALSPHSDLDALTVRTKDVVSSVSAVKGISQ
ncbi:MAG: bifunctional 4-hydroxy-2-oxoglutarate aldolase/2-dehydro-3-deoxy-phosphogluconate aldolase [Mycobacterium sp.]